MDKFLGFKTEEILTCLLLVIVGYFIAKIFSGCGCANRVDGFSVGGNYKCVRSIPTKKTCTLSECNPGGKDNQGTQLCQGCDGWMLNEYLSTDNPFLKTLKYECVEDGDGDFENINDCNVWKNQHERKTSLAMNSSLTYRNAEDCPKPTPTPPTPGKNRGIACGDDGNCDSLCECQGAHFNASGQCVTNKRCWRDKTSCNGPYSICYKPSKSCTQNRDPFTNDAKYTNDKGDCPKQTPDQTCCYATTTQVDFYQYYKKETQDMINKCENDLKGSFTGPRNNEEVKGLGFPSLKGKNKGNELFCYYNDNEKHQNEHSEYCDNNPAYENGHGYFCSFPSNKKHNHNRPNLKQLRHKRNMLRDELTELQASV